MSATTGKSRRPSPSSREPLASSRPGMGAISHEAGTDFRVWAPNAKSVHVTGSFNNWADPGIPLVKEGEGLWSVAVDGLKDGEQYKFRLKSGKKVLLKVDPRARMIDPESGNGVIYRDSFDWQDHEWTPPYLHEAVIYELHVGTFSPGKKRGAGTFETVIRRLPYLKELGINAIELMPPTEFPGETSWGYNPCHPFAVEASYGGPDGLKTLIREAHKQGIAVLLDVVYNHFGPGDLDLWQFDGWSENEMGGIYFYNDERAETPWGHTRPDYGRHEVRQYLRDNALMWIEEFRADGLRMDAVSYIRRTKGNEHHESVDLAEGWQVLQWINKDLKQHSPRIISIAEDLGNNAALTAWVEDGGAGFDSQWDASFVHPVRAVLECPEDDVRDIGAMVAAIVPPDGSDAFRRVIYSESHDEVANGKQRMVSEIDPENPSSVWARRRAVQAAGVVLTSPGVPMLFQGQEFLEDGWFDDQNPLDWDKARRFRGIRLAYRDLIGLRRNLGGFSRGLTGQNVDVFHRDAENKVLAWHRWHEGGPRDSTVVILNLSNREHDFYELTLPAEGEWVVRFNADWTGYSSDFGDADLSCVEGRSGEIGHPSVVGGLKLPPYGLVVMSQD
ncbi:alpha-amylase family glycosyl hydrolase [Luteolibacter sp. Populi]|uniref:alpha-amylase family glycosyl hydrolase n=1 Tax=Luteolibacter sp. Populi TaxID=3230487 RepID=UPI003467B1AB